MGWICYDNKIKRQLENCWHSTQHSPSTKKIIKIGLKNGLALDKVLQLTQLTALAPKCISYSHNILE